MSNVVRALVADEETPRQLLLRWTGATLCVAAMHAGTVFAFVNWPEPVVPAGEPPAAVMLELAPMPVAPEALPTELAVGPEHDASEENTPSEEKTDPVEEKQTEPVEETAKAEPLPEPVEPEVKSEDEVPELVQNEKAEVVLQPPAPKPPEVEEPEEKKPDKEKEKVEKEKSQPRPKSTAQAASAPKPMVAPKAKTNAAPVSGTASSASNATWRGMVMAHMNRHKRHPGGGARGTSLVLFTIDRSGRVISARLIRSSGSSALDQAALSLARRASPVPAPPANVPGGASIKLTVPIRFSN